MKKNRQWVTLKLMLSQYGTPRGNRFDSILLARDIIQGCADPCGTPCVIRADLGPENRNNIIVSPNGV